MARLTKAEREEIASAKEEAARYRRFMGEEFNRWFTSGRPLADWYTREVAWKVRGLWFATKGRR